MRRELDVAANNIANVNTNAFKGERVIFREYISQPNFREKHSFVDDVGNARDTSAGTITPTGNPLDLALNQEGAYFVVETPMGERYTRNGRFQLDLNGDLINGQGYRIIGNNGPINLTNQNNPVTINGDGTIVDDATPAASIDRIKVVTFNDETLLRRAANGLYIPEEGIVATDSENPKMVQGALEQSNVQAIVELTRIMELSREYQAITEFGKKEDERIAKMINAIGAPAA